MEVPLKFTLGDVAHVIESARSSKAFDLNRVSMMMLRKLDEPGVGYLAKLINLSFMMHGKWP